MNDHKIVSHDEWTKARMALLADEKAFTRQRDELSRRRRELPWVKVDKQYLFDTPNGRKPLADLFAGRSQLIVYHFMFGPEWSEGCPGCSYVSDHWDGSLPHINQRDVTFVAVSRAPLANLEAFKKRMGWKFPWVSSNGTDFNRDFNVSFAAEDKTDGKVYYNYNTQEFPSDEAPGLSIFHRDANGDVFHTYSTYGRGLEDFIGAYRLLDVVPKGRDEAGLQRPMSWVRHHDRYDDNRPLEFWDSIKKSDESRACCKTEQVRT